MLTSSVTSVAQRGDAGGRAEGTQDLSRLASASSWDMDVGNIRFQEAQWGGVGAVNPGQRAQGKDQVWGRSQAPSETIQVAWVSCSASGDSASFLPALLPLEALPLPARDRQTPLPTSIAKAMGTRKEIQKVQVRGSGDRVGTPAGGVSASEGSLCPGES